MGYDSTRFTEPIDDNLLCSVCGEVLEDAVLSPCGHSFCQLCIQTWLETHPTTMNCPECRSFMSEESVRPIHSIRNLVGALKLRCENLDRGCTKILNVSEENNHKTICDFSRVTCAGCSDVVNRIDLADHHLQCEAIICSLHSSTDSSSADTYTLNTSAYLGTENAASAELSCRVAALELQLQRMKRELDSAEISNRKLDRELTHAREELESKRQQLVDHQALNVDPGYEYGHTPLSIVSLSTLISRFLLKKPAYIDSERIFRAVKRCYDNYGRCGEDYEHDVHMLLATVYASNWFTDSHKLNVYFWLQSIARHRKFLHDIYIN